MWMWMCVGVGVNMCGCPGRWGRFSAVIIYIMDFLFSFFFNPLCLLVSISLNVFDVALIF